MSFFGAGGGIGVWTAGWLSAVLAGASLDVGGGASCPASIVLAESPLALLAAEPFRDRLDFVVFVGFVESRGTELAVLVGRVVSCGVISATALGFPTLLTCRLLITVVTPATLAA
jgi:hypothetical protein